MTSVRHLNEVILAQSNVTCILDMFATTAMLTGVLRTCRRIRAVTTLDAAITYGVKKDMSVTEQLTQPGTSTNCHNGFEPVLSCWVLVCRGISRANRGFIAQR